MVDPVLVGIVLLMVLFVFFIYLMIRRTVTEFKEGARREGGG
jgi:preprotein translocase subunit YajC